MTGLMIVLVFAVAMTYASVGHGGASGYLALMALYAYDPAAMASSALLLNLLVAGTACVTFWQARQGSFELVWPFAVASVPAAFLGGWLPISSRAYSGCLAAALLMGAWHLSRRAPLLTTAVAPPRRGRAWLVGTGIGLLSGLVGVGGGIFLSPLVVLCRWASVKQTAALAAAFIVVNSCAGLLGRLASGRLSPNMSWEVVAAAAGGGMLGSWGGAHRLSSRWLRYMLALVLLIAAGHLVGRHG